MAAIFEDHVDVSRLQYHVMDICERQQLPVSSMCRIPRKGLDLDLYLSATSFNKDASSGKQQLIY